MKQIDTNALKSMWKEGVSTREMGRRLGCSAGYVCTYAKRHKLKPRRSVMFQPQHSTVRSQFSSAQRLTLPKSIPVAAPTGPVHYFADGIDLRCHYPLWEASTPIGDRFYCGEEVSGEGVFRFCAEHRQRCLVEPARPKMLRVAA